MPKRMYALLFNIVLFSNFAVSKVIKGFLVAQSCLCFLGCAGVDVLN